MSPDSVPPDVQRAARQEQFLDVISRDDAERRFRAPLTLAPCGVEEVSLSDVLGRSLAADVIAPLDVPGFDRSNVDGFAVRAADTFGAMEEQPRLLQLNNEVLAPGMVPELTVLPGTASPIATGGMIPRGADAVIMVEHTELTDDGLQITRAVGTGEQITFAGADVALGETVLRGGQMLGSREIGVLAALGMATVEVVRRPRVAILSTGDEIVAPGQPLPLGGVYDSNAAILAAAVTELGGEPLNLGAFPDDEALLESAFQRALASDVDVVLLSGGTSKGAGDLSYRIVAKLKDPGIVAHGVALKPGKPICLAVTDGKPVVILPGFPTSAIFTFHEFVAPVIRVLAGRPPLQTESVTATLPHRINSNRGRTEYVLVGLVRRPTGEFAAYPLGKGSGSVTTFSAADGFITIPQQTEIVEAESRITVQLLDHRSQIADLVVIGSHCVGLDLLLGKLQRQGVNVKALHVGSSGGLAAVRREEGDLAGIHLMDPETGEYNQPYVGGNLKLVKGYGRLQGIVFRRGDTRFKQQSVENAIRNALGDPHCTLVSRNAGSGTRILLDQLLDGAQPPGYGVQAKSHNAVATAVSQGRADWGLAIDTVAVRYDLGFLPVQEEQYDFVIPASRYDTPAVQQFLKVLADPQTRQELAALGFRL